MANLSVAAGHFQWGVWNQIAQARGAVVAPRVFLMLREPVDRAISLYYERLFPHTGQTLRDMSEDDLTHYLAAFRGSAWSAWRDEGFKDTACRLLCGLNVFKGTKPANLETPPDQSPAPVEPGPAVATEAAAAVNLDLALARLDLTVVSLL